MSSRQKYITCHNKFVSNFFPTDSTFFHVEGNDFPSGSVVVYVPTYAYTE